MIGKLDRPTLCRLVMKAVGMPRSERTAGSLSGKELQRVYTWILVAQDQLTATRTHLVNVQARVENLRGAMLALASSGGSPQEFMETLARELTELNNVVP